MKIDGTALAEKILADLTQEVKKLGKTPTLAVVQVGDDPGSTAYIGQKKKAADIIGAKIIHEKLSSTATADDLRNAV